MKRTIILTLFGLFILNSCNDVKKIKKESEAWRETTLELADRMKAMANDIAKAIPGERYQRLIEQANSSDPEVRGAAKGYIKRLFNVDIDSEYVCTVSIQSTDPLPIHMTTFQAASKFRDEVLKKVVNTSLTFSNIRQIESTPSDIECLRDSITKVFINSFDDIVGRPAYHRSIPTGNGTTSPFTFQRHRRDRTAPSNYLNAFTNQRTDIYTASNNLDKRREIAVKKMVESILLPIKQFDVPLNPNVHDPKWRIDKVWPYMFFLIKKSDFDRIKDHGFELQAVVHKKGDPNSKLYFPRPLKVQASDFDPTYRIPVKLENKNEEVVWYAHDMTGYAEIYTEHIKNLTESLKRVDSLEKVQNDNLKNMR